MERLPRLDVKVSEVGGLLKKRRTKRDHYEFREARLFRFMFAVELVLIWFSVTPQTVSLRSR